MNSSVVPNGSQQSNTSLAVELIGLYKQFGSVTPISELNLEVRDGEFLVILGPSGSGKSTLLRLIAGLEQPTGGRVLIDGRDVTQVPARDRGCAFVFQSYALFPHLTVLDNIAYGLRRRGTPSREAKATALGVAQRLGLADLTHRRPRQLSGGQRQRVALGRAIARRPRIFLFDEPLSSLDAQLRVQMRSELVSLHHELQNTAIFVTHDQVEALTMGDRVAVLHGGHLQQVGPPLDLYERPANVFVAGFVGSPRMNFFQCSPQGDGYRLGDALIPRPAGVSGGVVCGLRPESVRVSVGGGAEPLDSEVVLRGALTLVERLGADAFAHIEVAGQSVVARVGKIFSAGEDDQVVVHLDLRDASWFDAESGDRLPDAQIGG